VTTCCITPLHIPHDVCEISAAAIGVGAALIQFLQIMAGGKAGPLAAMMTARTERSCAIAVITSPSA